MSAMTEDKTSMVRQHDESRGQILIIVALGLVAMVAMVGLVVDGGYAWGKQRDTQNASDAAAEAGAVVLAHRLGGATKLDLDVDNAVDAAAAANGVTVQGAYYTDVNGDLVDPAGAVVTTEAAAARVGDGIIPTGAQGVRAVGSQTFDTFLVRVIGVQQLTAITPATAVSGFLTDVCSAESGCDVIPITFPVTVVSCDGLNNPAPVQPSQFWQVTGQVITIPLCKNGPGNVGWIDWSPTAGGTSELEDSILNPDNPPIELPSWKFITSTGNINTQYIYDAINTKYAGKVVQIPQFDSTCDDTPTGPFVTDCPVGHVGGNGAQQWYHIPQFSAFQLCGPTVPACVAAGYTKGAYNNNGSERVCGNISYGSNDTSTSCLAGIFVRFVSKGTVGPGTGTTSGTASIGVQLIR
jgi:hypothetical protein